MSARIPLLDVRDFGLEFRTRSGTVRALEAIDLQLHKGEIVGLVGESGSGKSVLSYAMLGISDRAARVTGGSAVFGGLDLLKADERTLADLRGREISMIFQSPRTALNPIRPVGQQIEDVLRRHAMARGPDLRVSLKERAVQALREVAIADPERRVHAYPFEMSGGMCQRVMIALALACRPQLLIADEPTTGLDVTTQAAVMDLITELARERQMATLFITHDLALAADYCDRIVVMHAGHAVEAAPTQALFAQARHPYTARLMTSTPGARSTVDSLLPVPGNLPDLRRSDLPACRFAERCTRASARCLSERPPLQAAPGDPSGMAAHAVACWHPLEQPAPAGDAAQPRPDAKTRSSDPPATPCTTPMTATASFNRDRPAGKTPVEPTHG
jgi:peptide/nickel transport system ATP-binding protein